MTENKPCPFCSVELSAAATRCTNCGGELSSLQAKPAQKKNSTRTTLMIIGGVFAGLFVLALIATPSPTSKTANATTTSSTSGDTAATTNEQPSEAQAPAVDVYTTSAVELFQGYERNEVAMDKKIAGRPVEVSGKIQSIDKDFSDSVVLQLATTNEFSPASLTLNDSESDKAAALENGQAVTVHCERMQRVMGSPAGSECKLI